MRNQTEVSSLDFDGKACEVTVADPEHSWVEAELEEALGGHCAWRLRWRGSWRSLCLEAEMEGLLEVTVPGG